MKWQTEFSRCTTLLPFVLLMLLLASCMPIQQRDSATIDPSGEALIRVTASQINGNSSQVAVFYALERGIFRKHGLDVELSAMKSASQTEAALISGNLDFALMSATASIHGAAAGADPVVIGGIINTSVYALMVTAEIQTAADLVGKAVAINQPGGGSDLIMRKALIHLGVEPDEEVTLLSIGGQSDRMAAMETGQVVGTLVTVPESIKATENGFHQLFDVASLELPTPYVTVSTTRSYLATNRPQAVQFMAAISEAIAMMKEDKADTIVVLAQYLLLDPLAEAAALEEAYRVLVQENMEEIPYPTVAGIEAEIEILAQENPEIAKLTATDLVDMSLVQELEESGFFKDLYE